MEKLIKKAKNTIIGYVQHFNGTGMGAIHPQLNIEKWVASVELAHKEKSREKLTVLLTQAIDYLHRAHQHFVGYAHSVEYQFGAKSLPISTPDHDIAELQAIFAKL